MPMTAAQVTTELQRKKSLGIVPTSQANTSQYNSLPKQPVIPDPNKGVNPAGTRTNTGAVGLEPVKANPIPSPAATTTMNPASTQAADYQAWKTKQDELFSKLEGLANSQFSYDPNTDPAYQAQRDLAKLRAGDANRSTMETMNDRGLLQSTVTNSQLDQNNQRAEQEAAAYIPQYREQAYGQFQDKLSNAANLLGVASGRADTAYTRDYQAGQDNINNSMNEAQLTGTYQSPEARTQIDALLELKRQAEAPGITAEQRAGISKQADGIRSKLSSMGVDIAKLGANTNSSRANAAAGVQTMAAKDQAFQQVQQEWENNFNQAQFDENNAARIWEQAFQEKNFAQSMKDAAASRGLQWASLNQRDKEFIADSAFREKQFTYQKDQDLLNARQKPPAEISVKESTSTYNTVLDDIKTGATKEEARDLLSQNSTFLNDADYKKINDYINDTL